MAMSQEPVLRQSMPPEAVRQNSKARQLFRRLTHLPPPTAPGNLSDAGPALGCARELGKTGLRSTLTWQIARMLSRLGFAASLAIFAGQMIEAGAFSVSAFIAAIITLALSAGAG